MFNNIFVRYFTIGDLYVIGCTDLYSIKRSFLMSERAREREQSDNRTF